MAEFALYIGTALALIMVIEGLLYALFPDMVRKMMAIALMMDIGKLRRFGVIMALGGVGVIWMTHMLTNG